MYKRRKTKFPVDNFFCTGCGASYNRGRLLIKHQGDLWPGCPNSWIMRVVYDCRLIAYNSRSFVDKTTGEKVEYAEAYFLNETEEGNREVLAFNTKLNLKGLEDKEGNLVIEVDASGKQKPRLVEFVPRG